MYEILSIYSLDYSFLQKFYVNSCLYTSTSLCPINGLLIYIYYILRSHELLVVRYNGILNCYYVSPTDGYLEAHTTVLNINGVSYATWHHKHNLLFVSEKPYGDQYIDVS